MPLKSCTSSSGTDDPHVPCDFERRVRNSVERFLGELVDADSVEPVPFDNNIRNAEKQCINPVQSRADPEDELVACKRQIQVLTRQVSCLQQQVAQLSSALAPLLAANRASCVAGDAPLGSDTAGLADHVSVGNALLKNIDGISSISVAAEELREPAASSNVDAHFPFAHDQFKDPKEVDIALRSILAPGAWTVDASPEIRCTLGSQDDNIGCKGVASSDGAAAAGRELLSMLRRSELPEQQQQPCEPVPLSFDEFKLWEMEAREDREAGADARNEETFGKDAMARWTFEDNLAANERIARQSSLLSDTEARSDPVYGGKAALGGQESHHWSKSAHDFSLSNGSAVFARYQLTSGWITKKWYPAHIVCINIDGTYQLQYEDSRYWWGSAPQKHICPRTEAVAEHKIDILSSENDEVSSEIAAALESERKAAQIVERHDETSELSNVQVRVNQQSQSSAERPVQSGDRTESNGVALAAQIRPSTAPVPEGRVKNDITQGVKQSLSNAGPPTAPIDDEKDVIKLDDASMQTMSLECLIKAMRECAEEHVQRRVCKVLVNRLQRTSSGPNLEVASKLRSLGGLDCIHEALSANFASSQDAALYLGALALLGGTANGEALDLDFDLVVKALRRHDSNAGVQGEGLLAIAVISRLEVSNAKQFINCGGIEIALEAMRRHPSNLVVQKNGCQVISFMASAGTCATSKMFDLGAVNPLCAALRRQVNVERVVETANSTKIVRFASKALKKLAVQKSILCQQLNNEDRELMATVRSVYSSESEVQSNLAEVQRALDPCSHVISDA
eukprot:TRINITY_DN13074_c0_g2_i1.p1 TRINITY_DN13074_c0_g2~~TRINITY_DN13074_c0_g2_i1.p1  ORF type:complete len:797 (-),score=101.48 TRINITY_DN13074_c0_g2_i1:214-2604(-)